MWRAELAARHGGPGLGASAVWRSMQQGLVRPVRSCRVAALTPPLAAGSLSRISRARYPAHPATPRHTPPHATQMPMARTTAPVGYAPIPAPPRLHAPTRHVLRLPLAPASTITWPWLWLLAVLAPRRAMPPASWLDLRLGGGATRKRGQGVGRTATQGLYNLCCALAAMLTAASMTTSTRPAPL